MTRHGYEASFIAPRVAELGLQLVRYEPGGVLDEAVPLEVRYLGKLAEDATEHLFAGERSIPRPLPVGRSTRSRQSPPPSKGCHSSLTSSTLSSRWTSATSTRCKCCSS